MSRRGDWPLQAKMAVLLVFASAVPIAVATIVEFRSARALMREQGAAVLHARGDEIARQIDFFHREYQKAAARLASVAAIRRYLEAPASARPGLAEELTEGLRGYAESDANYRGLGLFDAQGNVAVATEAPLRGRNYGFRRYFLDAMAGRPATSEIYVAVPEVGSVPSIAYAAPVMDDRGAVIGVVALWVKAEPFWTLVEGSNDRAGPGSYAVLLDRYGIRIAHSADRAMIFRPTGGLDEAAIRELERERRFGDRTRELLQSPIPFPEVMERKRWPDPETEAFRGYDPSDRSWSVSVATGLQTVPWTLVYLVPERALDAPVLALVRKTVLGSALIIVLAFAAGIAFAGRIAEQLSSREAQVRSGLARLEAANKELESFSYSVSHDLRAPLRHIAGFVDLLERHAGRTLDEKGQRYLATISASAVRMGQLIDDLLSFSRMGRGDLMKTRVALKPLVAEVARQLKDEQGTRPVDWRIGELDGVVGDPAMLRVVFTNLLSNALKYTRGRTPAVIEVGALPGSNGDATVFVRDNGAGFDMQYAGKLFGVFQRLHSSQEFEGTGIGLATVRRIVDRHGGSVRAEGRPGEGATFYVTLPSAGPPG